MADRSEKALARMLERHAPFVPVGSLLVVCGHAGLCSRLARGEMGQTDPMVMVIPIPTYLVATIAMLVIAGWAFASRRRAGRWYLIGAVILGYGLVMAVRELNAFLMVA